MKKKIILLPVIAVLTYLSLGSNGSGPSTSGGGNATGSPGANNPSCGVAGCHSPSAATVIDSIVVLDLTTNSNVTKYVADRTYKITIHGRNATKTKWGFQASIYKGTASTGTMTSTMAGTAVKTSGAAKVIEHTAPITLSGGHMMAEFQWKAPSTGASSITVYAAMNAVNGDLGTGGDEASAPFSKVMADGTNVNDIENNISLLAFPNPAKDYLNLKMENAPTGSYTIVAFDLTGRKIAEQTENVTGGTYQATINTYKWPNGIYHLQISKDGQVHTLPVVKQ